MGSSERSLPTLPPMRMFSMPESSGYTQELPQQVDLSKNPLAETHEFRLACAVCFEKTGKTQPQYSRAACLFYCEVGFVSNAGFVRAGVGVLEFSYHPEEHKCKKDLLIGRIKHAENQTWKLIRPRPTKNQYMGLYYICKGELRILITTLSGQKKSFYNRVKSSKERLIKIIDSG